jgi:glucose/arabinose dehydrogenase
VEGGFYGWPYCYVQGGKVHPDSEYTNPQACARTTLPTLEIQGLDIQALLRESR